MDSRPNSEIRVLVTGASGYIAMHCVQQLLSEGYKVRGTVRDPNNEKKIKPLKDLEHSDRLELVTADLEKEGGWDEAVGGCDYVLHVASPFPIVADESIIDIAVNGTLTVLRAAAKTPSVKKVVLTSSVAAINEGHDEEKDKVFSEADWTNVESKTVLNYSKSKTLAEKAAWDFVKSKDVSFKLTTINPTLVVGPLLHNVQGASITIVRRFLNNEMPAVPGLSMGLVDVRDVARAHIRAMRIPETDGERILMTAVPAFWFLDIANALRSEFSPQGYFLPRFQVPYPVLWLYSFFDRHASQILSRVGREMHFDNTKARKLLSMEFIDPKESLIAMAYDMIDRGIVYKHRNYKGRPSSRSPNQN